MISMSAVLAEEFELLKKDLLAAYEASGMKASGKWGDSLEIEIGEDSAELKGYGYINGRKPGTPPPSEAIEQWIKTKGIASKIEKDMTISSLAILIARKIGREGWQPKENIIDKVITAQRMQQIISRAGYARLQEFTTNILDYLKTAST